MCVARREAIRPALFWLDTLDLSYSSVADGDGPTRPACDADVNVGGDSGLPRSAAHPFDAPLNQILDQHDFDGFVEDHRGGLAWSWPRFSR